MNYKKTPSKHKFYKKYFYKYISNYFKNKTRLW